MCYSSCAKLSCSCSLPALQKNRRNQNEIKNDAFKVDSSSLRSLWWSLRWCRTPPRSTRTRSHFRFLPVLQLWQERQIQRVKSWTLNITNKLSCELELHLLMHSCFLNSSTMPSFFHSWNKRRVYYKRIMKARLKCNKNHIWSKGLERVSSPQSWSWSWLFQGPRSSLLCCSEPAQGPEPGLDPARPSYSRCKDPKPGEVHTHTTWTGLQKENRACHVFTFRFLSHRL